MNSKTPNYPAVYATPTLGPEELRVLLMIENLKSRIRAATGSDGNAKRWFGPLRRHLSARALVGSNSIEGINVTRDEADALVANEEPPLDERTEAWLSGQGWKRAMTYVLQAAQDKSFAYDESALKALHFMMLEHEMEKRPGRWRDGAIFVQDDATGQVVYEGPEPELIPGLIASLIHSLEPSQPTPSLVVAAMAHLNLVMIHPFKDGNGRMSRCLQSLVLARTGTLSPVFLSIEEYLGRFTADYYKVLAETGQGVWNPGRDATQWVRFCLAAHFFQGSLVARRIQTSESAWRSIEKLVHSRGLPDRSVTPLIDAFLGRRIRNAYYREVAEVSEQVATNDLAKLVKAGLLESHGEKKGRSYTRGPEIQEVRKILRADHVLVPHPFREPDAADEFSREGLNRAAAPEKLSLIQA